MRKKLYGHVLGGIGNQMFQYAFYKYLSVVEKRDLYLDLYDFKNYPLHNGFELSKVFGILPNTTISDDYKKLIFFYKYFNKLSFFLFKKNTTFSGRFFVERYFKNEETIYRNTVNVKYVKGYFQTHKYIKFLRDNNVFNYNFQSELTNAELELIKGRVASVHIRGGDYLDSKNFKLYGGICTPDYYRRAISYLKGSAKVERFLIFTNDINYAQQILPDGLDCKILQSNIGKDSFRDMLLMSHCQHNIIANSSFSWWAAYLNQNPNKQVVAPKIWFNDIAYDQSSIVPDEWMRL